MDVKIGDSVMFCYYKGAGYWSMVVTGIDGSYVDATIDGIVVPPPALHAYDPWTRDILSRRTYKIPYTELSQRTPEAGDDLIREAFKLKLQAMAAAKVLEDEKRVSDIKELCTKLYSHLQVGQPVSWSRGTNHFTGTIKSISMPYYGLAVSTEDGQQLGVSAGEVCTTKHQS